MFGSAGAHLFDIYSDLNYIIFVPTYMFKFTMIMIVSFSIPILVMLITYRCCKFANIVTGKFLIIFYLGFAPIYLECIGANTSKFDIPETVMSLQEIFFLMFEDGPQFVVQGLNTLLIGRSLSWMQLMSTMSSLYGISSRLAHYKGVTKYAWLQNLTFWPVYACCVMPLFLLLLVFFTFND